MTEVVKAGYWSSTSGFLVASIESSHFTHLFAAFAELDGETFEVAFPAETWQEFSTFTETVQKKNPYVKTLLSIGGPSPASNRDTFALMANQESKRASFISSSIKLARENKFHGLDLCWLYPSTQQESSDLGVLLEKWHDALHEEAKGKEKLLLTAQVFYSPLRGHHPYPVTDISGWLDWINVMAYGFYSPNTSPTLTRIHAAWLGKGDDPSGKAGIEAWIKVAGKGKKQFVLGLAFFGCAWKLVDVSRHDVCAPAQGASPDYGDGGFASYNEIATLVSQGTTTVVPDSDTQSKYCYNQEKTWISYEDESTIINKIRQAKKMPELLGYFAWHVGTDTHDWILSTKAAEAWDGKV